MAYWTDYAFIMDKDDMRFSEVRTFSTNERRCGGPIPTGSTLYTYRMPALPNFVITKERRQKYKDMQFTTRFERWFEQVFCRYIHRGKFMSCPRCEKLSIQKWQHDHEYCCMAQNLTRLAE